MRSKASTILFKVAARFETSRTRLKRLLQQPALRAREASPPSDSALPRAGQRHLVE